MSQTLLLFPKWVHSESAPESQGHGLKGPHLQCGGNDGTY
jgi:hypothetical protein